VRYGSGVTDDNGEYRIYFTMPATWPDGTPIQPGDLTVLVATDNFAVQASDTFTFQANQPSPSPKPYVNVNPESGGPETPVTVSGGGFPPNAHLNAYLARVVSAMRASENPEVYASTTADAAGNFTMSFTIPRTWKGTDDSIDSGKLLVVVATDNFSVQASDSFDYFVNVPRPSINLSPASGGAGTPVTVSGGGFPANLPVGVYLGVFGDQIGRGSAQRYATGVTDGDGNYRMTLTMPATWPDGSPVAQDRLIVMVASDDFSVQVSDVFNYLLPGPVPPTLTPTPTSTPQVPPTATPQSSLALAPTSGRAGTVVTVVGVGFPGNTPVALYLAAFDGGGEGSGRNQQYAAATTDASGAFALAFTVPAEWPNGEEIESGRLVVLVATNDFGTQASTLFDYQGTSAAGNESTEPTPEPATPVPTATATPAPTDTVKPSPTNTATPVPTNTATPVPTDTATSVPTATATPLPTDTATPVPTATATPLPTDTATPIPTETPVPSPTESVISEPLTATPTEEPPTPTDTVVAPTTPISGTNP
jgi:hypothetical protein